MGVKVAGEGLHRRTGLVAHVLLGQQDRLRDHQPGAHELSRVGTGHAVDLEAQLEGRDGEGFADRAQGAQGVQAPGTDLEDLGIALGEGEEHGVATLGEPHRGDGLGTAEDEGERGSRKEGHVLQGQHGGQAAVGRRDYLGFVHGGLLPAHLEYGLEALNRDTRAWLRGEGPKPSVFQERDDPVWARQYSDDPDADDCALLDEVLAAVDCDRMFVGHTVQEDGVTANCNRRVWCLDAGAAAYYGGTVQVVEITPDTIRVRW